jgi:6-phosphogluconolactonase/glucosamine-6-phosphate isomerase/deaminase
MQYHYIKENVAQAAGNALDQLLGKYQHRPVLLLLSAGSSLSLLPYLKREHLSPSITISMLDERYTQKSEYQNFSRMADSFFFETVTKLRLPVIDTRPQDSEDLTALAERLDHEVKEWMLNGDQNGAIIATAGIGTDGHIAGILPDPANEGAFMRLFNDSERYFVGYEREGAEHPCRITATLSFLKNCTAGVITYATGREKTDAISRTMATKGNCAETPARILNDIPCAHLFTDIHVEY